MFGRTHTASAFKTEGLRHHGHRENAQFLRNLSNHRRSARSRTAAHAGRNKEQIGSADRFRHLFALFLCGSRTDFRTRSRTQSGAAELDVDVSLGALQCLMVRIGSDKLNALGAVGNHVLDGIAAAATHTDHLDAGVESSGFTNFRSKIKGHSLFPCNP